MPGARVTGFDGCISTLKVFTTNVDCFSQLNRILPLYPKSFYETLWPPTLWNQQ